MIGQLLEVLIGLVLVYLIFSTITSALVEAIEMVVQKRGKLLEQGIEEILNAVAGQRQPGDLKAFYDSPFISSLFRGSYKAGDAKLPSYIPAERFADAALQLARENQETFKRFIGRMTDAIGPAAASDLESVRAQCVRYFNESMERVSGWYQRYARWWLLLIGFCIAAFGNVDTLHMMRTLSQDDSLREQVVEEATRRAAANSAATVAQQLQLVDSLGMPIGWTPPEVCAVFRRECPESDNEETLPEPGGLDFLRHAAFWSKLFGVLLTTFALTFGAPFWFDLLNQLVNLRTSLKPKATESDETTVAPDTKPSDNQQPANGAREGAPKT